MIDLTQYSPKTLEEAVTLITQYLTDPEIDTILANGALSFHHSAGMAMRNAWLWDNPKENRVRPLAQHFRDRFGLGHADDMSSLILSGIEASCKNETFDPEPHVTRFKQHWKDCGVDALTQESSARA